MATPSHELLRRVAEASKSTFALYKEGVYLESSAQRPLEHLRHQVAADRMVLAYQFVKAGERFIKMRPPEYRSAISRFYYAMYHSIRAVVYYSVGGDDHQDHGSLPKNIPSDFPNKDFWENSLKSSRTSRNSADYDPYPGQGSWRSMAHDLSEDAVNLVAVAESYLKQRGCSYL